MKSSRYKIRLKDWNVPEKIRTVGNSKPTNSNKKNNFNPQVSEVFCIVLNKRTKPALSASCVICCNTSCCLNLWQLMDACADKEGKDAHNVAHPSKLWFILTSVCVCVCVCAPPQHTHARTHTPYLPPQMLTWCKGCQITKERFLSFDDANELVQAIGMIFVVFFCYISSGRTTKESH